MSGGEKCRRYSKILSNLNFSGCGLNYARTAKASILSMVGGLGTCGRHSGYTGVFGGIIPVLVKGTLAAAGAMVGGRLLFEGWRLGVSTGQLCARKMISTSC